MNGDIIGTCPFCGCDVISDRMYGDSYSDIDLYPNGEAWSARHPFGDDKDCNMCIGRNVNFQWFSTEEALIKAFTVRANGMKAMTIRLGFKKSNDTSIYVIFKNVLPIADDNVNDLLTFIYHGCMWLSPEKLELLYRTSNDNSAKMVRKTFDIDPGSYGEIIGAPCTNVVWYE